MNAEVGIAELPLSDGVAIQVPVVKVTLSERNLRTLLLTLNEEHNDVSRLIPEVGFMLVIASEPNEVHYKDREAGLMSEDVELKLVGEELDPDKTLIVPPEWDSTQE